MSAYPISPTFPIDVRARPGSGISVTRRGAAVEIGFDGTGGPGGSETGQAAAAIANHQVVRLSNGALLPFSPTETAAFGAPVRLSLAAATVGDAVPVTQSGTVTDAGWQWTPDQPVYAGAAGGLTQSEPSAGILLVVGVATSATTLSVRFGTPILL